VKSACRKLKKNLKEHRGMSKKKNLKGKGGGKRGGRSRKEIKNLLFRQKNWSNLVKTTAVSSEKRETQARSKIPAWNTEEGGKKISRQRSGSILEEKGTTRKNCGDTQTKHTENGGKRGGGKKNSTSKKGKKFSLGGITQKGQGGSLTGDETLTGEKEKQTTSILSSLPRNPSPVDEKKNKSQRREKKPNFRR